ncbi:hypothetical protein EYR41_001811 [Orbilia oligospora]|uniref:Uncharacterized protein n=1 Tax=Orbilia oligospora TaxID=2813651 RepID=A0A7C8P6D4_ORBOL|nr:hypothetical protein TWF751_008087 [Orbilia oligospora]KAF3293515.1 hypothetical protein TWF132_004819 [Orbilia oligospora]TGJ74853.1 hypothetical protein EYR41_001811 [Orbilia oligospora]
MDQPHPFSPPNLHQQFPLSFFEEDMLLFTGGHQGTPHDLAAWENMGMGQGRSVSSLMDPYTLDLQQATAAATSPTLQSPMDTSTGFNNNNNGGGGGRTGGKKRGSNVDVLEEDEDHHLSSRSFRDSPHNNQSLDDLRSSNTSGGLNQPQKRRRKDTTTTTAATTSTSNSNNNNYGSNTDDLSSNDDDTGSNDGGRRESLVDGKRPERPRLTEEEKKNNHIASEQKRRMAIRDGFDRLTELVPGIEGQGRSESIVLRKTVDHMRKVIEDRRNLIAQVQELGGEVPQDLLLR